MLTWVLPLGYSDSRIDQMLRAKSEKHSSSNTQEWAIDLSRPTFIKVNRKYLSPDTLDHYRLPWEWDKVWVSLFYISISFPPLKIDGQYLLFPPTNPNPCSMTPNTS